MSVRVKLRDIVDGLDVSHDEMESYLDRQTGKVIQITQEEMTAAEDDQPLDKYPDWEHESIEIAREIAADTQGRFVPLPTQFDIHEYSIMEDFCFSVEDEETSDRLVRAIKGQGAFRRFKDLADELGISEQWYAYRNNAFKKIAKEWCEANEVPYVDE